MGLAHVKEQFEVSAHFVVGVGQQRLDVRDNWKTHLVPDANPIVEIHSVGPIMKDANLSVGTGARLGDGACRGNDQGAAVSLQGLPEGELRLEAAIDLLSVLGNDHLLVLLDR